MLISSVNKFNINFRAIAGLDISAKKPSLALTSIPQDRFEKTTPDNSVYEISAQDQIMGACGFVIPDLTITLTDKVNGERLAEAINEALELHPLYNTQALKNETGLFVWAKNDKKPIVQHQDLQKDILFGTEQYNNFPWLVRYNGNQIIFNASHMLNDGAGALNFIKTFLRLYFEKSGIKFKNADKWDITKSLATSTTEDAYLRYGKADIKTASKEPQKDDATVIPKEFLVDDEQNTDTYRFFMDKQTLKNISAKTDTSPASIISYLLSKALEKSLNLQSGVINLPIPVNCRANFPSNTDRNFIHIAPLSYDVDKMKDLSLADVAKIIKQQLKTSVTDKNMLSTFKELSNLTDAINANPQIIHQIKKDSIERKKTKTATICYSHITKTGLPAEFDELVQNVDLAAAIPLNGASVCVFGLNFKDKTILTVRHLLRDNLFIENLKKVLTQENIDFVLSKLQRRGSVEFKQS